ncbi:hypothetical protein Hanom_Chr10g00954211 [Helianthus anomalus]
MISIILFEIPTTLFYISTYTKTTIFLDPKPNPATIIHPQPPAIISRGNSQTKITTAVTSRGRRY